MIMTSDGAIFRFVTLAERRFALSLLISILLHTAVLLMERRPAPARSQTLSGPLEVSFRGRERAQLAAEPTAKEGLAEVKLDSDSRPPVLSAQTPGAVQVSAVPATPRRQAFKPGSPGEARLVIVVGDKGRPGELIWEYLPAITQEQFDQLEQQLRTRIYANVRRGTPIAQTIDVFALLQEAQRRKSPLPMAADDGAKPAPGKETVPPAPTLPELKSD